MKNKMLALFSASVLALTSCTSHTNEGSSSDPDTNVTIGLTYIPDVQFAPFYVAEKQGYFEQEGIKVKLRHHGAQESLMGALQAGDEDVVVAGGDEMTQARSTGTKVYNWATLYQEYPVKLIVPEASSINSIADIRGKTIGLPGEYGENYYTLLAMLSHNGLSLNDVKVQYIGYTQAQALTSGKVDAVIGFVNSDAVAIAAQGVPVRTIEPLEGGLPLVGAGLGSLDSFKTENNESEKKILAALDRAVQYMRENPEGTLDIVEKYVETLADPATRTTAKKVLEASIKIYGTGSLGTQDSSKWASMVKFMKESNLLESNVEVSEVYLAVR